MAFLPENRVVFELLLPFFPDGLHKAKLLFLEEKLKKSFTHYLPKGGIFRAVVAQDGSSTGSTVKFQIRTPLKLSQTLLMLKDVSAIIKQYACFFTNNDTLEATGHNVDLNRYNALKNKLKQEEQLEFINIQELRDFLDALLHEERDVINNEEELQLEEEPVLIQELRDFLNADMHERDVINYEEQLRVEEELIPSGELRNLLEADLHERDVIYNGKDDEINYEERDVINYEKQLRLEEELTRNEERRRLLQADVHERDAINNEEEAVIACEEPLRLEEDLMRDELRRFLEADLQEGDVINNEEEDEIYVINYQEEVKMLYDSDDVSRGI